jgi:hypothetical protein
MIHIARAINSAHCTHKHSTEIPANIISMNRLNQSQGLKLDSLARQTEYLHDVSLYT